MYEPRQIGHYPKIGTNTGIYSQTLCKAFKSKLDLFSSLILETMHRSGAGKTKTKLLSAVELELDNIGLFHLVSVHPHMENINLSQITTEVKEPTKNAETDPLNPCTPIWKMLPQIMSILQPHSPLSSKTLEIGLQLNRRL